MDVRNILRVQIAKRYESDGTTPLANGATTQVYQKELATYPSDGQVVVTSEGGTVLTDVTATAAVDKVQLRQQYGTDGIILGVIPGATVKSYKIDTYAAPTEQITIIGSDGTSGALTTVLTADTDYQLRFVRKDDTTMIGVERYNRLNWNSGASTPTEEDIANGLNERFYQQFITDTDGKNEDTMNIICERLSDATTTASVSGDITVINGSTTISAATDIDNGGMVVGDYFDLNGVLYKAIAIDTIGNTATLDIPYQGVTAVLADAVCNFVTAANATAGSWGLRITGLPKEFEPGIWRYEKTRFDVETNANITAIPNTTQAANRGVGTYEEAAEAEWNARGFEGDAVLYKVDSVNNSRAVQAVEGTCYDRMSIYWEALGVNDIGGSVNHSGTTTTYIPQATEHADAATYGFVTVMDAYLVAHGTGTAQTGNLTP